MLSHSFYSLSQQSKRNGMWAHIQHLSSGPGTYSKTTYIVSNYPKIPISYHKTTIINGLPLHSLICQCWCPSTMNSHALSKCKSLFLVHLSHTWIPRATAPIVISWVFYYEFRVCVAQNAWKIQRRSSIPPSQIVHSHSNNLEPTMKTSLPDCLYLQPLLLRITSHFIYP